MPAKMFSVKPFPAKSIAAAFALGGLLLLALPIPGYAAEAPEIETREWSWDGIFGQFDKAAAQRGLQVYKEVCAACHGLRLVAHRNLADLGYNAAQIKAFAAEFEVTDGPNEDGDMYVRPARPSDRILSPFANDNAARAANNGALPPDLSVIVEARAGGLDNLGGPSGADYVYALLTGYAEAPKSMSMSDDMHYNKAFPGHQIAMIPPLEDGLVEYADGTKATVAQMSHDVTTFLAWAAEPNLEARKAMGLKVMLFLIFMTILVVIVKRRIWARVH